MFSYRYARTSFARRYLGRYLGKDDNKYDRNEIKYVEGSGSGDCFYELSIFNDSNSHLTPQPSATNLDSANEPLSRVASTEPLFRAASTEPRSRATIVINSIRHPIEISSNHRSVSRHQRYCQGWRVGVIACAAMTGTVFLVNTVLTVWASVKFGRSSFIGTIQEGKCDQTKHLGLWLHLAINILSTLLLSASNYCMQCLSSPTRAEINKAHNEKRWLDIGVPSVKNLREVSRRRITLWCCLALSSIPLHLMYNSAVFSTLSTQVYFRFTVDADFLTRSSFDLSYDYNKSSFSGSVVKFDEAALNRSVEWLQDNISSLTKLDNAACIKAYGNEYLSSHGDLLLVSSTKDANNSVLFWNLVEPFFVNSSIIQGRPYDWICPWGWDVCDPDKAAAKADEWVVDGLPIDYCLSRKNEEHCKLQFSLIIMIVVILCNLVKMICMIVTLWKEKAATLVTLGDAISSFLNDPDPITAGYCLADKDNFTTINWNLSTIVAKQYMAKRHRWFRSASLRRWAIFNVLCLCTLITASILLNIRLKNGNLGSRSFSHLQKLGFGAITSESLISSMNRPGSGGLIVTVLVANSPQVILSFLYLNYNGLFTCMLMASEWSGFAHERKYLRVTSPVGKQRSSYRLQIPYIYGIPLLIISGILHWLVSQSIFLAKIDVFDFSGAKLPEELSTSTCGYSLIAIITVIGLGSVVMLAGIVNGFRRYDAGMPLVGSCSAAISAACHPKQQDEDMAVLPVKWGAEKTTGPIGHCSFSSFEVDMPIAGESYC